MVRIHIIHCQGNNLREKTENIWHIWPVTVPSLDITVHSVFVENKSTPWRLQRKLRTELYTVASAQTLSMHFGPMSCSYLNREGAGIDSSVLGHSRPHYKRKNFKNFCFLLPRLGVTSKLPSWGWSIAPAGLGMDWKTSTKTARYFSVKISKMDMNHLVVLLCDECFEKSQNPKRSALYSV